MNSFKTVNFAIITFALSFLPAILDIAFKIKIDLFGCVLYIVSVFMTIFLGNAFRFYDKFFWWDRLAHFFFGIVFISFGIAFAQKLEILNKFNLFIFSFTFSVTLQTLWEVLEYIADSIFHSNNQRWQNDNKTDAQPAGLVDTMTDTIFFIIGSLLACFAWWFIIIV